MEKCEEIIALNISLITRPDQDHGQEGGQEREGLLQAGQIQGEDGGGVRGHDREAGDV